MRKLRGWSPRPWLYKGYGVFQYDLQYVGENRAFFEERQWWRFDRCLDVALAELKEKHRGSPNLWTTVRRYNGDGPRARTYANNVVNFYLPICRTVTV
jgi:hypothetical protein